MALGTLGIIFVVLIVLAILLQVLLYKSSSKIVFLLNVLLSLLLSALAFTALPSNYTGERVVAIFWAVLAIIALIVNLKVKESSSTGKLLLTVSILGGLAQLMLF